MKNQTTKIKLLMLAFMLACIGANAQTYTQVLSLTGPGTSTWTNTTGATVTVRITARGGDGGRYPTQNGGSGATEVGEFTVANGETIRAIAGGAGSSGSTGGGGGGSGAVNASTNTLLLIAGAGGGGRSAGGGQGGFAFNGSNQGSGNGGAASIFVGGGGGLNSAGSGSITSGGGQVSFSALANGSAGYNGGGNGANGMGGGSGGCYLPSGLSTYIIGGNGGGYTGGGGGSFGGLGGTSYNTGTSQVHTGGCDNCGGNPTPVKGSVIIETITFPCTAPTLICPSNISVNASANCNAMVTYTSTVSGTTPLTENYSFSGATSGNGSGNGSGSTFNKGTTTVTLSISNSCGSANCSFNVIVTDNTIPTITCPSGFSVNADLNSCTATNVSTGIPVVSDNCSGVTASSKLYGNSINNSTPFSLGNNIVVWTATDASGNTATCNQIITVIDNQPPTISAPANTTVAANNAGCTYLGSTGSPVLNDNCSGVNASFSPQGPYALGNTQITWIATDASGNTAVATQTITVLPIATSSVVTHVKCKGTNSGEIDLTVSQSNGALSYLWNTGSTNQDVNNLFAGSFTVTVTNSNGCTKTSTFSISQPLSILTVSLSKTNIRCGGKATGEAIAGGSGGVAPYSYTWNNGSTTETYSNLVAGTYTVTVTDAAGCSKTKTVVITQNPAQTVSVIPMPANQYFADNGGGVAPYSYYWNTVPAQTTQTATISNSGSNYKVKVTDSKGCTVLSSTFSVGSKLAQSTPNEVGIAVMPNPTTGIVTLTINNCIYCNVQINMFDAICHQVYSKELKVEKSTTLDFNTLATGIYNMQVIYDGKIDVLKIVKE